MLKVQSCAVAQRDLGARIVRGGGCTGRQFLLLGQRLHSQDGPLLCREGLEKGSGCLQIGMACSHPDPYNAELLQLDPLFMHLLTSPALLVMAHLVNRNYF